MHQNITRCPIDYHFSVLESIKNTSYLSREDGLWLRALAMQEWGPEFALQVPPEKPMGTWAFNPSAWGCCGCMRECMRACVYACFHACMSANQWTCELWTLGLGGMATNKQTNSLKPCKLQIQWKTLHQGRKRVTEEDIWTFARVHTCSHKIYLLTLTASYVWSVSLLAVFKQAGRRGS